MTNVPAIPTRTTPPLRAPWYRRLPMAIVAVVVLLLALASVSAFGWPGWANNHDVKLVDTVASQSDSGSAAATTDPSAASSSSQASATDSDSDAADKGDTKTVTDNDGKQITLPAVSGSGVSDANTRDVNSLRPISSLLPTCAVARNWADLVNCIESNDAGWYKDGINAFAANSGFNWSDIEAWGKARTVDGGMPEARVIEVYGHTKSQMPEDVARQNVVDSGMVSSLEEANTLPVYYYPAGFVNTWKTQGSSPGMTRFHDGQSQVRISLQPLQLNKEGQAIGVYKEYSIGGIFADCFNLHWRLIIPQGGESSGTTPPATTGTTPPPSTSNTPPPRTTGTPPATTTSTPECPPGWSGKPPHCLKNKSDNPTDYRQPGDDNARDAGTGTKPKATAASTADSRPPAVVTKQTEPNGIVDDSTKQPGSEVGVVAPGAAAPSSSRSIPPAESGVNPPSSSGQSQPPANTGDPGMPAGW